MAAVPAGRARALRVPRVRLHRFTAPVPTVDIALAYPGRTVNLPVLRLLALLEVLLAGCSSPPFALTPLRGLGTPRRTGHMP